MSEDEYKAIGVLGKGGFASVFLVLDKAGNKFALKKPFHDKKFLKAASGIINMKELYIMACVDHPYIQSALKIYYEDPCPKDNSFMSSEMGYDKCFFLMTKADYTCHELVQSFRAPISHVKRAMFQITCAVYELHTKGICHRDLKPGNFLCYYDQGVLTTKLTDFGMTKPLSKVNRNSLHAGTLYYRAPELMLRNMDYGYPMDIWSLACSFFEMVCRKPLFKADTDLQLLQVIFKNMGSPHADDFNRVSTGEIQVSIGNYRGKTIRGMLGLKPNDRMLFDSGKPIDNLSNPGTLDQFCDLLKKMLAFNPDKRLDIEGVIKHPFFSGYFKQDPYHYNIWVPELKKPEIPIQIFPEEHFNWQIGANEFIAIEPNTAKYDDELQYSVRFQGLDIYSRFLLRIHPVDDPRIYQKIAWVSGYIASKYYLDEGSDHLWDIFPNAMTEIDHFEIIKLERLILQILDFEIYRPTCFTFIQERYFYAALFALMLKGKTMYNRPVIDIMNIFNNDVSKILNHKRFEK